MTAPTPTRLEIRAIVDAAPIALVILFADSFLDIGDAEPRSDAAWRDLAVDLITDGQGDEGSGAPQTLDGIRALFETIDPKPIAPDFVEPRFVTSEMQDGLTASLSEMLEANADTPDVCEAIRALGVGEQYVDLGGTVTRIS